MSAASPIPPAASRQDALGQLEIERWHAAQTGESGRVAELDAQIRRLSAHNSPAPPARETTAAAPPRRETARAARPADRKAKTDVVRD